MCMFSYGISRQFLNHTYKLIVTCVEYGTMDNVLSNRPEYRDLDVPQHQLATHFALLYGSNPEYVELPPQMVDIPKRTIIATS